MRTMPRLRLLLLPLAGLFAAGAGAGVTAMEGLGKAGSGPLTAFPTTLAATPRPDGCGGTSRLDECLAKLKKFLEKSDIGIPASKEELYASCSAFKTGMGCVDEYSRNCLTPESRRVIHEHVASANYTFRFLCDDKKFQDEYLRYTPCYKGISGEWESCANRFMQLVREEMARKNATEQSHMLEICCAKYGFLRCVYMASRNICRKEEAFFLNRIAESLSAIRMYTPVCRDLDVAVCAAPGRPRGAPPHALLALALALLLLASAQNYIRGGLALAATRARVK